MLLVASALMTLVGPASLVLEWGGQAPLQQALLVGLFVAGCAAFALAGSGRLTPCLVVLLAGGVCVSGYIHVFAANATLTLLFLVPLMLVGQIVSDARTSVWVGVGLVASALALRVAKWQLGLETDLEAWISHTFDSVSILIVAGVLFQLSRRRSARDAELLQEALDRGRVLRTRAEQSAAAARMASDAKSTFLARVSHELRTPLNAILGYAELIQEERSLCPEVERDLGRIHHAGASLLALIDDVLDLSRIEAGRLDLHAEPFHLCQLVDEVATTVQPLMRRSGTHLATTVDADTPEVRLDRMRVRQILLNLLSNAAKFTQHGRVTLSAEVRGETVVFEVEDTGIGIPEERLAMLFEPFIQGTADTAETHGGTGLGLAVCDRLVRQMGGHIQVRSELGAGSAFAVLLPFGMGPPEAAL